MLTSKHDQIKPLLESKGGIHLTIYLVNRGDLIDLKLQLRTILCEAYEWLDSAMSLDERRKFLEPVEALLDDARIFKEMKGNIGLFRNASAFRVLNIPVEVDQSCQVATSFHVKPLLRWLQGHQEFLLLGLESQFAHLYLGSQDSFKHLDSITFKEALSTPIKIKETSQWINSWILNLTKNSKLPLFLAGEESLVRSLGSHLEDKNRIKTPIAKSFSQNNVGPICQSIRKNLKEASRKSLQKTLREFRFAEEENRAKKNIFQISKAVAKGKVSKLIVTDELSIFGKIDLESGGLTIHPFDLDHEDDCVLDDLAQMVLSQGGQVIVAKRDEIPKGRPILAILDDDGDPLEKTEDFQYKDLLGGNL